VGGWVGVYPFIVSKRLRSIVHDGKTSYDYSGIKPAYKCSITVFPEVLAL
jgi:hypothetical protein